MKAIFNFRHGEKKISGTLSDPFFPWTTKMQLSVAKLFVDSP